VDQVPQESGAIIVERKTIRRSGHP
jgi:hypothetical protein